jgi:hypothetical protein
VEANFSKPPEASALASALLIGLSSTPIPTIADDSVVGDASLFS